MLLGSGSGWWFQPTPLKNMMFVSWDDDYSQYDGKVIKFHGSSHHQPDILLFQ